MINIIKDGVFSLGSLHQNRKVIIFLPKSYLNSFFFNKLCYPMITFEIVPFFLIWHSPIARSQITNVDMETEKESKGSFINVQRATVSTLLTPEEWKKGRTSTKIF